MNTATWSPGAFYVALDTSGSVGSVAVGRGGEILALTSLERQGAHAASLVPAISDALEAASVDLDELAGIVVGEGPGSFTGVRVAGATAKGMAHALGIPLWAVSSLAAAALSGEEWRRPSVRYVLFDARGDRVYGACYGIGSAGMETLVPPHGGHLRDVLGKEVPVGSVFVGQGATRHEKVIAAAGFPVQGAPAGEPTADAILRWLAMHPDASPVASIEAWEPRYLRASSAERAWPA